MVVDSIKKLMFYFINSKESLMKNETTMNTAIVSNSDSLSLYEIVENCLKDNVSRCDCCSLCHFCLYANTMHMVEMCAKYFYHTNNIWWIIALWFTIGWELQCFLLFFLFVSRLIRTILQETFDHYLCLHNWNFEKKIHNLRFVHGFFLFCVNFKVFWTFGATVVVLLIATFIIIWQRWFNRGMYCVCY